MKLSERASLAAGIDPAAKPEQFSSPSGRSEISIISGLWALSLARSLNAWRIRVGPLFGMVISFGRRLNRSASALLVAPRLAHGKAPINMVWPSISSTQRVAGTCLTVFGKTLQLSLRSLLVNMVSSLNMAITGNSKTVLMSN